MRDFGARRAAHVAQQDLTTELWRAKARGVLGGHRGPPGARWRRVPWAVADRPRSAGQTNSPPPVSAQSPPGCPTTFRRL